MKIKHKTEVCVSQSKNGKRNKGVYLRPGNAALLSMGRVLVHKQQWVARSAILPEKKEERNKKKSTPTLNLSMRGMSAPRMQHLIFHPFQITYADIALAHWLECWPKVAESTYDLAGNHPKLIAHQHRVFAHPKVAAWREKRPKTEW